MNKYKDLTKYSQLNLDKQRVYPTFDGVAPLVLLVIPYHESMKGKIIKQRVVKLILKLYVQDNNKKKHLSKEKLFNKVQFALSYLYCKCGKHKMLNKPFINGKPEAGIYYITSYGKSFVQDHNTYGEAYKHIYKIFKAHKNDKRSTKEVNISNSYDEGKERTDHRAKKIKKHLIKKIKKDISSRQFEILIQYLLKEMKYKGVSVTQQTRDNGIDDIVKNDYLGVDPIGVQDKEWWSRKISGESIQEFIGALDDHNFNKGIFITTSKFSKAAIHNIRKSSIRIVPIDLDRLLNLFIKFNTIKKFCKYSKI